MRIEWEEFSSVKCSGGGGNERAVEPTTIRPHWSGPLVSSGDVPRGMTAWKVMCPTVISRGCRPGGHLIIQ